MAAALAAFLVGYAVAAYLLFSRGLAYFGKIPAAGSLLTDRLIYIIFFCFLMMLAFSVGVTGYIALYRSRDTRWLLSLPVSHRVIFLWKTIEAALFSSWGLVFITAPLLLAFARVRHPGAAFYAKTGLALIPFLIITSTVAAVFLVTAVRWFSRRQIWIGAGVVAVIFVVWSVNTVSRERELTERTGLSAALTFQQVLRHTEMSVNRFSPSTWLAGSVLDWTRPKRTVRSWLYPSLLASYALMGGLATAWAGRYWYYDSWNRSVQAAAIAARRSSRRAGLSRAGELTRAMRASGILAAILGRPLAAVTRKDALTFRREPGQWVQFVVVFGLLALYATGLRRLNQHLDDPRDLFLVAYLNLAVCALALSTLTTRFVFPQFSLEGRRLWILAMSPLRLPRVVLQKFFLSLLFTSAAAGTVVAISGNTLELPPADVGYFTGAVLLLSLGLNAMAVGFGVLFPNLEESNAAKIVSGFGGTLCLVSSFVFITTILLLLTYARLNFFDADAEPETWLHTSRGRIGVGLALLLSLAVTVAPLIFAMKRLKRLEILGNL